LIDASKPKVQLIEMPLPAGEGLSLTTPKCFSAANGKDYAWVIHHQRNSEQVEKLTAIDLDPNGDKDFSDAAIVKTLELGPSKIEGHSGYHEVAVLPLGYFRGESRDSREARPRRVSDAGRGVRGIMVGRAFSALLGLVYHVRLARRS
jgi:hypothetical protein